ASSKPRPRRGSPSRASPSLPARREASGSARRAAPDTASRARRTSRSTPPRSAGADRPPARRGAASGAETPASVALSHHEVEAPNDRDEVGQKAAAREVPQRLDVEERRRANADAVRRALAARDNVVAELALRRLDGAVDLADREPHVGDDLELE